MLIETAFGTLGCLAMFLWPNRRAQAIEERIKAGDDRSFEEQRTYRAYPYLRNPRRIRLIGAVGTVCGLAVIAMEIYRG